MAYSIISNILNWSGRSSSHEDQAPKKNRPSCGRFLLRSGARAKCVVLSSIPINHPTQSIKYKPTQWLSCKRFILFANISSIYHHCKQRHCSAKAYMPSPQAFATLQTANGEKTPASCIRTSWGSSLRFILWTTATNNEGPKFCSTSIGRVFAVTPTLIFYHRTMWLTPQTNVVERKKRG